MSLTRKMLKAMGIEEEKIDQIIEAHTETVDALKESRDGYKKDAEKLSSVQAELDDLKSKGDDGWKEKHDQVKREFDTYKGDIEKREKSAAQEKAVRAYLEAKGITGKNLEIAMRGCREEVDAVELDGESIKDTTALDSLIAGDFSALVSTTNTKGANTPTPPANTGGGSGQTKEEILSIKDGAARRKAMSENPHLFGLK